MSRDWVKHADWIRLRNRVVPATQTVVVPKEVFEDVDQMVDDLIARVDELEGQQETARLCQNERAR